MTGCTFSDDQIEEFLNRVEKGEAVTRICEDPHMPAYRTITGWLREENTGAPADFATRFHDARANGIDAMADDCVEIADEKTTDAVAVQRNRLRVDTRLRLMGKWAPSKYGEKLDITSKGKRLERSSTETATRIAALLGKAAERRDEDDDVT